MKSFSRKYGDLLYLQKKKKKARKKKRKRRRNQPLRLEMAYRPHLVWRHRRALQAWSQLSLVDWRHPTSSTYGKMLPLGPYQTQRILGQSNCIKLYQRSRQPSEDSWEANAVTMWLGLLVQIFPCSVRNEEVPRYGYVLTYWHVLIIVHSTEKRRCGNVYRRVGTR